jgi:hypothetical protein
MMYHPDLLADAARQHAQGLIVEASRHRLARALRRRARQHWPDSRRAGRRS